MVSPALARRPRGAVSEAGTGGRTTGETNAVPKTGSLITFMSSLKSFAFPTQRRAGAGRVRWTEGWTEGWTGTARLGGPGALAPPRGASRRSTGSRRRACGPALPRRARPPGARPRHPPPPPGGARRCCCGCARSAGPRRGAGLPARTRPRTTRRTRTRRRPPLTARRAGRRRPPGWRSSAGPRARSSRRRARRWARAPGLRRESAGASGPSRAPSPPTSHPRFSPAPAERGSRGSLPEPGPAFSAPGPSAPSLDNQCPR